MVHANSKNKKSMPEFRSHDFFIVIIMKIIKEVKNAHRRIET